MEDKHFYRIWTVGAELSAQISGKAMHEARSDHSKLPKVGDWVAVKPVPNEEKAVIQAILPRRTRITRKTSGRETAAQILATNIETVFLVTAADASFNAARLERMLVMAHDSGARPVVILNKNRSGSRTSKPNLAEAAHAAGDALVLPVCALTGRGLKKLSTLIKSGDTVAFIGTSGVGKSSLINQLYGEDLQATMEVRADDAKGRHTTSWREMIFLPQGGVVIDTPGMREFHIWAAGEGARETFPEIEALAAQCHFRDCTHTKEKDCAVLAGALAGGTLARDRHESFVKLQLEISYLREAEKQAGWQSRKKGSRVAHRVFNKQD